MQKKTEFALLRAKAGFTVRETAELVGRSPRTVIRYEGGGSVPPHLVLEALRRVIKDRRGGVENGSGIFRFVDLFAGIGGLRIPFEEGGGRCVFTSEWDKFACQTYRANFSESTDHEFAGDIRPFAENPEGIPRHDLLLAGFPCQPFSIAGVSKKNALGKPHGFMCDTQGTLFYDLARIIKHHQPAVFVLENVKHLQRHDRGRTFATIKHVLSEELGYDLHYRVICSSPWVPQKRERIFMVGFRQPSSFDFGRLEFPSTPPPVLGNILENAVDSKYTLSSHLWDYLQAYRERHRKAGNGFGYSVFGPDDVTRTLSARYFKDGAEILVRQEGERPRRLTPRECARLMGFDAPGGPKWRIIVSDTQAYRQFGNAVVVPLVRALAALVKPCLMEALARESSDGHC